MIIERLLIHALCILSIAIRKISTQIRMELYVVEECKNNTIVADLTNRFITTSYTNGFFRLFDQSKLFYIEEKSGKLRTKARIDRESICQNTDLISDCTITLLILYHSSKMTTKPMMINSLIHILDINDHAPNWNKPNNQINLQIPEHSFINSAFRLPEAIDLDHGPENTTKSYFISKTKDGQAKFDIRIIWKTKSNSKFGSELSLIVLGDLDREKQSVHNVVITAVDGGNPPLSGELKVNIEITDINDHPPRFKTQNPVKIELPENTSINKKIIMFEAEDPDSSDVNNLKFSFLSTTDDDILQTFWLKERNGELLLQKSLDYEVKAYFSFFVQVSDGKFHSSIEVEVKVLNVNDNAPKISIQSFIGKELLSVPENSESGQHIGIVVITDEDDKSGLLPVLCVVNNPIVELSGIDDTKNKFLLKTTKTFDREIRSFHIFTITCSDTGEPTKKSSVTSRLHITDVNDNPPVFLNSPMKASVKENMPSGTFIYQLKAHDEDTDINANFRYYLQPDSEPNFKIDSITGQIFSKVMFNAEEDSKYEISVYVNDTLDTTSFKVSGLVELTIEDVNDNPPRFDRDIYHFSIFENVKTGTLIDKVEAKDIDKSEIHRTIKYGFKKGTDANIEKHISITQHGMIYVRSSQLDREENASFTFYVIAMDNGNPSLTTSAYVQIEVKDVNDNSPEWIYPDSISININITYHLPVGHEVTKFEAKDIDQGVNSELEYFIAQMTYGNGIFQLQSTTGVLYIARTLTVQDVRSYRMVIGVRDNGIPPLSKLRPFRINILHQLDESKGFALFGKFEGDLLIILVLVIVTLIICLGLISAIWFLKCGSRPSRWCYSGSYNPREHLRPPDGHSPSPSHEIMPVFMDRRHDSFISNITKTTCSEKMKNTDLERDELHLSTTQPPLLNNKCINNYQCLQQIKDKHYVLLRSPSSKEFPTNMNYYDRSILNNSSTISSPFSSSTIRRSPNCQTTSSTPVNCLEIQTNTICKSHTLPKDICVPSSSNSQLSVRWLDKQCQPNDTEEYQICISNRSTPKLPIIKVSRLNQSKNPSPNNLKDTEYTQLSSTTTFRNDNNDSILPMSYV